MIANIKHLFVLMLENRSFDHLFSFSGLPGVPKAPARFGLKPDAPDSLAADVPHEFADVQAQIKGGAMSGFSGDGLRAFVPAAIPTLVSLARSSVFFDNWYSSMPGPTWPNRLFAHAGSSGGLDNSLSGIASWAALSNAGMYMRFEHGHVYDRLVSRGRTWRVYRSDTYPLVLSLKGMVDKRQDFFRPIEQLRQDVAATDAADYTFIEPKYDALGGFANGNSQHPVGSVAAGEVLVAYVHNAIFQSPVADSSALLVTWDEHGGFFDHAAPPPAHPPNDAPLNHNRAAQPGDCTFAKLGVRVPAMLVSPWLPVGLGSTLFPRRTFDHTSIVSSLRELFALGGQITDRDGAAPTWWSAIGSEPRKINPLPARSRAVPRMSRSIPDLSKFAASEEPSGTIMGVANIAVDIDWHIAERTGKAPLIAAEFRERIASASLVLTRHLQKRRPTVTTASVKKAHWTLLGYLAAVQQRELKYGKQRATSESQKRRASPKRVAGRGSA